MLSHNRLPLVNGVPPYIAAATTGQVNTSILLASSIMYGWEVVRLQLGDALMKSFTLIAYDEARHTGIEIDP
jgi:hypothetical protein